MMSWRPLWQLILLMTTIIPCADPLDLFWQGQFETLAALFPPERQSVLSLEYKSLIVESLLQSGRAKEYVMAIKRLFPDTNPSHLPLPLRMALALSRGELAAPHPLFAQSAIDCRCQYYTFLHHMQGRRFHRAHIELEKLYDMLQRQNPFWHYAMRYRSLSLLSPWLNSVPDHCRTIQKLARMLKDSTLQKKTSELIRFSRHLNGQQAFTFSSEEEEIRLPLFVDPDSGRLSFRLDIEGHGYSILLDTGNAEGWMIHSMDLLLRSKTRLGLRRKTQIGTAGKTFSSQGCLTPTLHLASETLVNLTGVFIPNPGQGLSDANLNPAMIQNRIVVIDLSLNELIIMKAHRFAAWSAAYPGQINRYTAEWFGFQYPIIRLADADKSTLLILETGAFGITLRKDYAHQNALFGREEHRHIKSGAVSSFEILPFGINMGPIQIADPQAEIWPLEDYILRFGGLRPDLILGPRVFHGRIAICMNPFTNELIFLEKLPAREMEN